MKTSVWKHGIPQTNLIAQMKCSALFTLFSLGSLLPVQKHQNPKNTWITKGILKSRDLLKFYDMVVYVDDCDAMYVLLFHNLEFVIFATIVHRVFLYSLITLSSIVYLDHNNIIFKISSNPLYDMMLVGISSNSIGKYWQGSSHTKGWAGGQQMTLTVFFVLKFPLWRVNNNQTFWLLTIQIAD